VAGIVSISCASRGNCAGGGSFLGQDNIQHAFLVTEVQGVWRSLIQISGVPVPDEVGDNSAVMSVSCPPAGRCAASGDQGDSPGQGFVVSQR
jgi:hypothetical protein